MKYPNTFFFEIIITFLITKTIHHKPSFPETNTHKSSAHDPTPEALNFGPYRLQKKPGKERTPMAASSTIL